MTWRQLTASAAPPPAFDDDDERTLLEKVEKFQGGFIGCATQDGGGIDNPTYDHLRMELLSDATIRSRLPDFVRNGQLPDGNCQ
jgi:hypothetical protein